jgi:hypothetical protein
MKVRLEIMFETPSAEDEAALGSAARALTNDLQSVRVFPRGDNSHWLVAEFMMPTEAQYKAVDKIDAAIRFRLGNRLDSTIKFPKSEVERRKARRKGSRRKER